MSDTRYGGIIWTNHAIARQGQRGLSQDLAWQAYKYPDRTIPGKNPGTTEYQKSFGASLVTVIAKKNEEGNWIVLSNWIDPPLPGTQDFKKQQDYKKLRNSSGLMKILLIIKKQLGL
jgi:hypothetical protein